MFLILILFAPASSVFPAISWARFTSEHLPLLHHRQRSVMWRIISSMGEIRQTGRPSLSLLYVECVSRRKSRCHS